MSDAQPPLAHSPRSDTGSGDSYARHVEAVRQGARHRAEAMLRYARDAPKGLLEAIVEAATFHDLGKLDYHTQAVLQKGRRHKLRWDHVDAGVAHLSARRDWMAAWIVRAHHPPGLPEKQEHFNPDNKGRRLRGRRRDDADAQRHAEQIARTDASLEAYLDAHDAAVGRSTIAPHRPTHGLTMRLALSCLVDADHTDTAFFDTGRLRPAEVQPRWAERLAALCRYVRALPTGDTDEERQRNIRRARFFDACLNASIADPMITCEGPVGLGKTTAVAAYLVRRAGEEGLRRLIIVAPYTNVLKQTAKRLRKALVLSGERPDRVVMEHHHRADFAAVEDRDLAVLWRAPIILTTAVSFFESLAACDPASLRKLHSLPGSAIFIDEAHAALPARLWPQNWLWTRELAEKWSCPVVFASGSLSRFWENKDIVKSPLKLPELLPKAQADDVLAAERRRIRYARAGDGGVLSVQGLIELVAKSTSTEAPGPRLLILNTVQNAALVARAMREAGLNVMHLSTALTPRDRDRILDKVERRLDTRQRDWSLVATSCVEAGVDLSFRCAFRERFSVASLIQTGGRVNRHGEYDRTGGGIVFDFAICGDGITQHPAADVSADVLRALMTRDELNRRSPADLVTAAIREELARSGGLNVDALAMAENARDYPKVKSLGRVIDADTRLVVVSPRLQGRLKDRQPVTFRALLRGSVQLWGNKIEKLELERLPGRREIYAWNDVYEPDFLGCMAGILRTQRFLAEGGGII